MTPNTPAPRPDESPGRTGPRLRGRHRKPRPRKILLAAGGLALTAGALGLVRLASAPGGEDIGVEAAPRPSTSTGPARTVTDGTPDTSTPTPVADPSSPTPLGGQNSTPLTPDTPAPSAPTRSPATSAPAVPSASTAPSTVPPPKPTTRAPGPVTPPPPAPHRTRTPPPAPPDPPPNRPSEPTPAPHPGLCVPVIGLCIGGAG